MFSFSCYSIEIRYELECPLANEICAEIISIEKLKCPKLGPSEMYDIYYATLPRFDCL